MKLKCLSLLVIIFCSVSYALDMELSPGVQLCEICRRSASDEFLKFPLDGIDLRAKAVNGRTALHWAVEGRPTKKEARLQIVAKLLEAGADVNQVSSDGMTPLEHACREGWDEALLTLLVDQGAGIDSEPPGNGHLKTTALLIATRRNDVPLMQFLLRKGANPNLHRANHGGTALHQVFQCSRSYETQKDRDNALTALRLLLDAGAKLEEKDMDGRTPWLVAARANHLECLQELAQRGANLQATSKNGRTAMHSAAETLGYRDARVIALLSGLKLDPSAQDPEGNTPLHMAIGYGNDVALRQLLLEGADPGIANKKGERPVDTDLTLLSDSTIEMLHRYTPRRQPVILPAPEKPPKEI